MLFNLVFVLDENVRQVGTEEAEFREKLGRLRVKDLRPVDYHQFWKRKFAYTPPLDVLGLFSLKTNAEAFNFDKLRRQSNAVYSIFADHTGTATHDDLPRILMACAQYFIWQRELR